MAEERSISQIGEKLQSYVVDLRRHFHRNPELGLDCRQTYAKVKEELTRMGYEVKGPYAETGIVGVMEGTRKFPVIGFRVDMDALPIQEKTGVPFASQIPDAMHACGHDGHTAIGLGVAQIFAELRDQFPGTLKLIFQPGEEIGGALTMIEDGALEDPKPDAIFGIHIFPRVDAGKLGVRFGVMTARHDQFSLVLRGVSCHGAHPYAGCDPYPALAAFITGVQTIISRNLEASEPAVISIGKIQGGSSYNTIPETLSLDGTIRTVSQETRTLVLRRLEEILKGIQISYAVDYDLEVSHADPPLICDPEITKIAQKAGLRLWGQDRVEELNAPSMGADDFACFSDRCRVSYLRLGCFDPDNGFTHLLHSDKFNFDEGLMWQWLVLLAEIIKDACEELSPN